MVGLLGMLGVITGAQVCKAVVISVVVVVVVTGFCATSFAHRQSLAVVVECRERGRNELINEGT